MNTDFDEDEEKHDKRIINHVSGVPIDEKFHGKNSTRFTEDGKANIDGNIYYRGNR